MTTMRPPLRRRSSGTLVELDYGELRHCGRAEELRQLQEAFQRLASSYVNNNIDENNSEEEEEEGTQQQQRFGCETILVQGSKGSGKTSLLEAFQERIQSKRDAFVCVGEYSEPCLAASNEELQPYGASAEENDNEADLFPGLNRLLLHLAAETTSETRDWRSLLKAKLEPQELDILMTRLPLLKHLLNKPSASSSSASTQLSCGYDDYGYEDMGDMRTSLVRDENPVAASTEAEVDAVDSEELRSSLVTLIHTVSQHKPVVWFQDDVHLASNEQLELLKDLLEEQDSSNNNRCNLLFVGALIESGSSSSSSIASQLEQPPIHAKVMPLGNLNVQEVTEVLKCILHRDAKDLEELADVFVRRTLGHAQSVLDLLKRLETWAPVSAPSPASQTGEPHNDRLLYFSTSTFQWQWNLEQIVTQTSLDESLVREVLTRFAALSSSSEDHELKAVLKLAARVGPIQFRLDVLHRLLHSRHLKKQIELVSTSVCSLPSTASVSSSSSSVASASSSSASSKGTSATTSEITSISVTELEELLDRAVDSDFLERVGRKSGTFQFIHERVHGAARELLRDDGDDRQLNNDRSTARTGDDTPKPASFHLAMGRALLEVMDDCNSILTNEERNSMVLTAVYHLNKARSQMSTEMELYELAKCNFKAAKISSAQSSESPLALIYFEQAYRMLCEVNAWSNDLFYSDVLEIANVWIRSMYANGKIPKCMGIIEEVLDSCRTFHDGLRATRYKIRCLLKQECTQEALELTLNVVENLGFSFPSSRLAMKTSMIKFAIKCNRLAPQNGSKSDEERLACLFLQMEEVRDTSILYAAEFYHAIVEIAIVKSDLTMQGCAMQHLLQMTLWHGYTPFAVTALAGCAAYHARVGNYNTADCFNRIALQLIEQKFPHDHAVVMDEPTADVMLSALPLLAVGVDCWKNSNSLEIVVRCKSLATRIGYVHHIFISAMAYVTLYIQSGMALDPVYSDIMTFEETLRFCTPYTTHTNRFESVKQFVLNLIGRSKDPLVLTGEMMDEKESLKIYEEANDPTATHQLYLYKMFLAVFFGDFDLAEDCADHLISHKRHAPRAYTPLRLFCEGVTAFALARRTGKSSYKSKGKKRLKELIKMQEKGCTNVVHFVILLQAEELSLQRNHSEAAVQSHYDRGISVAGRLGLTHMQALGNELAGRYYLDRGDDKDEYWTSTYLRRAYELYTAWGAKAKKEQMLTDYEVLRNMTDLDGAAEKRGSWLKTKENFGDVSTLLESMDFSALLEKGDDEQTDSPASPTATNTSYAPSRRLSQFY